MSEQSDMFGDDKTSGKGSVDRLERYYTPDRLAAVCVGLLPWTAGARVLEPHAGGGAFLRALEAVPGLVIGATDLDPECWSVRERSAAVHDFLARPEQPGSGCDRVIGNPPFSNAEEHIERGLEVAPQVAFLLPMSRLETPGRAAFYGSRLRDVWAFGERVWPGSRQIGLFLFERAWPSPWHRTHLVPYWRTDGAVR